MVVSENLTPVFLKRCFILPSGTTSYQMKWYSILCFIF